MKEKLAFKNYLPEMNTTNRANLKNGDIVYIVLLKENDNAIIPHVFSKFENAVKFANKVNSKLLDKDMKVVPCPIKNTADL